MPRTNGLELSLGTNNQAFTVSRKEGKPDYDTFDKQITTTTASGYKQYPHALRNRRRLPRSLLSEVNRSNLPFSIYIKIPIEHK
jgi:hypothetical protein